ncbi:nitroreductase family protein [Candidatus Zixiibacteriota bacterium]
MISNPIIEAMLNRKSIRKYTDEIPSDEVIETIVRAAQQAPFAGQLESLLLSRDRENNTFHAPLLFTICIDTHKFELIMARRGWKIGTNDLSLLLFAIQDAVLMAENLVLAAESVGLGSCFIGHAPYWADKIIARYKLPQRVFPLVELAVGYPAENPPTRPRYPLDYFLFEDEYPQFSDDQITNAMRVMDEGFLAQDYYRQADYIVDLEDGRREKFTFNNYSWTEHISRKWGQWHASPKKILAQLAACGFHIPAGDEVSK